MGEREIVILTGVYGHRVTPNRVQPVVKGNRVTVSNEEAARLVALGVAAYVNVVEWRDAPAPAPVTPSGGPTPLEVSQHTPSDEPPSEPAAGIETGNINDEAARLERMTKADLEQMAKDLCVDVSEAKNKHEMAVLIAAADAPVGEEIPELEESGIVP